MNLADLKNTVLLIALVVLIASATAIALTSFQATTTTNGYAYNITQQGLLGVNAATSFMSTIGTVAAVAVLIGIVVLAFRF